MKVRDLMSTHVLTVQPFERAAEAWDRMRLDGVRHAVVVHDGRVVGVVSAGDLGNPNSRGMRAGHVVGELMCRTPVTASPEMDVREAARAMRRRAIGCLPILDGDKIAGILTTGDLLALVERGRVGRKIAPRKASA